MLEQEAEGVLAGLTVIEMAGIGPGPFCGMMLADHGATVIRIERPGVVLDAREPLLRSRKILHLDLKTGADTETLRALVRSADGLIEGYRPGVMERLGLGPDVLLADNPRLVYGRMTGWGQTGPLAHAAGHDINYAALTGTLHGCGRAGDKPTPPINLLGDFGGGAMMLAFGMVSGLLHVARGGAGQVIDCAMTDGAALLNAMTWGWLAMGQWRDERGVNMLDTGAHFYDTFECADGRYIALGAIEPQFYALFREKLGLVDDIAFDDQMNPAAWGPLKNRLTALFLERPRAAWCELLEGTDACFAPVLSMREAPSHAHNLARATFIEVDGVVQPGPAPRFSRTHAARPTTFRPFEKPVIA
jgi:alpha-methylacyl-CoA racemase